MKILIFGGLGYLGCRISRKLVENGYQVTVVDNFLHNQQSQIAGLLPYVKLIKEDVREIDLSVIDDFDVVINLAAIVGAPICDKCPEVAKEINYKFVERLVDRIGDKLLIFPNTNSSYGKSENICTEESPSNPISLYAQTKCDAEKLVLTCKKGISLRLATVFGLSERNRMDLIVNNWTYQAFFNKKLEVFEPHFRRNFIHVDDIAKCFLHCVENKDMVGQVYNVGLDEANMTKKELAETIASQMECEISFKDGEDKDKRDYVVSSQKLYDTGFKPEKTIVDGINDLKKFFNSLPKDHKSYLETMFNY